MRYPKVTLLLIDTSGSMAPAWDEAWEVVFTKAKESSPFLLLGFKDPRYHHEYRDVALKYPEYPELMLIDIGKLLRVSGTNVVRLRRRPTPTDVGLRFCGRTPLNAAIHAVLTKIVAVRPWYVDIYVVSDNRDTSSHQHITEDMIETAKRQLGPSKLGRLTLIAVGTPSLTHTLVYDEIVDKSRTGMGIEEILQMI